jgi:cytochrome c oxidase subunit II
MTTLIWICATLAMVIFGVMLHSVATFRSGATRLRRHALVEVAWALVPILIVVAAAVPSLRATSDSTIAVVAATE